MNNIIKSNKESLKLNEIQKTIWENLTRISQKLASMYLGSLKVISDKTNPDRIAQAAHSLREIIIHLKENFDVPSKLEHQEIFKEIIKDIDELGGPPEFVLKNLSKQWKDMYDFFTKVSHHKDIKEDLFLKNLDVFENILLALFAPIYISIDEIDSLLQKDSVTEEDVEKLIAVIKTRSHFIYFFEKVASPIWFIPLKNKGFFSEPPPSNPDLEFFPIWVEFRYLIKVANRFPTEILQIIEKNNKTNNFRIHSAFIEAILNMPIQNEKEIIKYLPKWIRNPYYRTYSFLPERLEELTTKLIKNKEIDTALKIFELLFDVTIDIPLKKSDKEGDFKPHARSYIGSWKYAQILKDLTTKFLAIAPLQITEILSKKLKKAIYLENKVRNYKDSNWDFSYIWRPDIRHDPSYSQDDIKNNLITVIRDILINLGRERKDIFLKVLSILDKYRYPIFIRLKLYAFHSYPDSCQDLINETFSDSELFDDLLIKNEYIQLLQSQFHRISSNLQETILGWIEEGPDLNEYKKLWKQRTGKELSKKQLKRYKQHWQLEYLGSIQKYLNDTWREKYNSIIAEIGEYDETKYKTRIVSWVGPTSPLSAEDMEKMTPKEILDYLISWNPPEKDMAPSPEGLGRVLRGKIKSRPQEFAVMAPELIKKDLNPAYVYYFFSGLTEAINENKEFNWKPVISSSREIIESIETIPKKARTKPITGWHEVKKAIASLLLEGFGNRRGFKGKEIPLTLQDSILFIIKELIKDPEPTLEYEEVYGGSNMAPYNMAINTVRGLAMQLVIEYSLWYARNNPLKTTETESKVTPEVKKILTERLDPSIEPTVTIRSVYGQYLRNLFYLDSEWVKENIINIFSNKETEIHLWVAAWQAYIQFSPIDEKLYVLLRENYRRAIKLIGKEEPNQTSRSSQDIVLVRHLLTLYLNGKESLNGPDSLFAEFLKTAPPNIQGRIIGIVGRDLLKLKEKKEFIERLKILWENRLSEAKYIADKSKIVDELGSFGWWFYNTIWDMDWTYSIFKKTLILTNGEIEPVRDIIKKISKLVIDFPLESIECIELIVKAQVRRMGIFIWIDDCKVILQSVLKSKNDSAIKIAENLINYFGLRGIHEFRDLERN